MVLRRLLRDWVGAETRRQVLQAAEQQRRRAQQSHAEQPADAPKAVASPRGERPLGLVFALAIESGGLEDLLEGMVASRGHGFAAREGRLRGRPVVLIRSGAGRQRAEAATEALLAGHRPKWVLSVGFAGGLSPHLRRLDIVVADELVNAAGNRVAIEVPPPLAARPDVRVGRMLTVDQVVRMPPQKHSLFERHGALAVDMESLAVCEVCRRREVPFLAVRVIHDAADDELPADVQRLLDQKTTAAQFGAALGAIWRRPSSAKDLYRLKENALLASDRLAKFLSELIGQLGPPPGPEGQGDAS